MCAVQSLYVAYRLCGKRMHDVDDDGGGGDGGGGNGGGGDGGGNEGDANKSS